MNSRLRDCLDIVRQMEEVVRLYSVDHVLILGDIFESRTKLDVDVVSYAVQAISSLAKAVPQSVWLLRGNHDLYARAGDVHSLEVFRGIDGVFVIDEPQVCLPIGGCRIAAYPYTADVDSLKSDFDQLSAVDLVLIHQALREGTIGPYARTIAAELSVTDLPLDKCRYVFAGDFHRRQFFGPDNRVHYIGSPLQLKVDEIGEEKGFTLLDTDSWQLYTIPTQFPKFHVFTNPQAAADAIADGTADPVRDFIRLEYQEADAAGAEELKQTHGRLQLDVKTEQHSLARTTAAITDSDHELLAEYAEQRNHLLPQDALVTVGLELLEGE
jgi:DNA repair exonuclease SbcCD nuclease subunit